MMNGLRSLITKLGYYKLPYRLTQAERNIAAPLLHATCEIKETNTTKEDFLFDCGWATIFIPSVSSRVLLLFVGDKSYFGIPPAFYFYFN